MTASASDSSMTHAFHARSGAVQVEPSDVRLVFTEVVNQQYFTVALATALIYHSITTIDKEIKYFWSKPRSPVSLIYFANRYVGLLGAISNMTGRLLIESLASCNFSYWTASLCSITTIILIDYILVIRVLALYQQNGKLAICLKCLVGLEAVLDLGLFVYGSVLEEVSVGVLAEGVTSCGQFNAPPKIMHIFPWTTLLTFGLLLLALALYKGAEYWRLSFGFKKFQLVIVLIQDQALYYGFVILCSTLRIVEASNFAASPLTSAILNVAGSPTLLCILGSHLLINLKEAGEMGVNEGTNYRWQNISNMDFAQGPGEVRNEQSAEGSAT